MSIPYVAHYSPIMIPPTALLLQSTPSYRRYSRWLCGVESKGLGVWWDLNPNGTRKHVFYQKMAEKAALHMRELAIHQRLGIDQKIGVYYYHLIAGNMSYCPLV